jgi:hypothetical protein
MTGFAVSLSEIPAEAVARLGLSARVCDRFGHKELQFHWWQNPPELLVRRDGRLKLIRWGCKDRRSRLPYGGWVSAEQLESGLLAHARPEEVVIPANLGHHKGTWFVVEQGVKGVVLPDAPGGPVVYVRTVPSTNYYRNMTGQEPMMPALVDQVI